MDYKKGNLKSVEQGLERAGADTFITSDGAAIVAADGVVLPGVGSFADASVALDELGLKDVLVSVIQDGIPFLGICLGLQLLFEAGEEHAEGAPIAGLSLIPGTVGELPSCDGQGNHYKIPHVGWNSIQVASDAGPLFEGIPADEYFYFTHSYAAPESDATVATTVHSIEFPCAVRVGERAYAVQFHPEKSSDAGARLLQNFVNMTKDA